MTNANAKPTAVLLCYSSAYRTVAQRIAGDLGKANVSVSHDPWRGGGGLPAFQSVPNTGRWGAGSSGAAHTF